MTTSDTSWLVFWLVALFAACIFLSHGRQFWSDEVFDWTVARDPSFHHMLFAWRSGADVGGIFFYLGARAWMRLFGESALALRLFTAFGVWIALAFTWTTARRWFRLEIVAVCLPFCWLTAHSVLRQLMIGRFYGLLLAATAAVVYCYALAAEDLAPNYRLLVAIFATNCLLVGTHPLGVLYSGVILAATLILDATRRTWRPKLYLAAIAGWIILWPYRFTLQASAIVAKPHFWTIAPTGDDLRNAMVFWTDELQWLWAILLVAIIVFSVFQIAKKRTPLEKMHAPSLIVGFALMAVIPLLWFLSLRGTSYFVDRYLLPTIIGAALLQCAAFQYLVPRVRPRWLTSILIVSVAAVAAGSAYSFFNDIHWYREPPHSYTDSLAALLPKNAPIVVERVDIFTEATTTRPDLQLLYLLDWDTVILPESPRGEPSGYHELENWQRAGYHAAAIEPSAQFLTTHSDFWVISDPTELWFDRRVRNNPAFEAEQAGTFRREDSTETIWHVRRIP